MTFLSASSLASVSKVLRNEWSSLKRDGSRNAMKQLSLSLRLDLEEQGHLESTVLRSFVRRSANRESNATRSVELLFLFNLGMTWPAQGEGAETIATSGHSSSESTPTSGMTILPWLTMEQLVYNTKRIWTYKLFGLLRSKKESLHDRPTGLSSNDNPCCTVLWAMKFWQYMYIYFSWHYILANFQPVERRSENTSGTVTTDLTNCAVQAMVLQKLPKSLKLHLPQASIQAAIKSQLVDIITKTMVFK